MTGHFIERDNSIRSNVKDVGLGKVWKNLVTKENRGGWDVRHVPRSIGLSRKNAGYLIF